MSSIPEPEKIVNYSVPEIEPKASDYRPKAEVLAQPLSEWSKAIEECIIWGGGLFIFIYIYFTPFVKQIYINRDNRKNVEWRRAHYSKD